MAATAMVRGDTSRRVSENVEKLRKVRGMGQADLVERLADLGHPMLKTAISKIERGQRRIDVDDLVALATALGVRPEQLLAPWKCEICNDEPPAGFVCRTCGAEGGDA